jgi:hypothetical protein
MVALEHGFHLAQVVLPHRACAIGERKLAGHVAHLPVLLEDGQIHAELDRHHIRVGRASDLVAQLHAPVRHGALARQLDFSLG